MTIYYAIKLDTTLKNVSIYVPQRQFIRPATYLTRHLTCPDTSATSKNTSPYVANTSHDVANTSTNVSGHVHRRVRIRISLYAACPLPESGNAYMQY